jgi:L-arabinose transport system ATP-binding protein
MERCLEFKNIKKSFPGVMALKGVSFKAEGGRVTALLGENGAGKSTLLKIMSGDLKQDEGEVVLNGKVQEFASPLDAIKAGISVIYQERQIIPALSVMENVFSGDLPLTKGGFVDKKKMETETQKIIDRFHLPIRPTDICGTLSVAYQQMVEIMKSYRRNSDIIAFDEPTSSLADTEVNSLFDLIRDLKKEGKVILYVSHRMAEIFEICDDIIVFKDGAYIKSFDAHTVKENELIASMVGRDIGDAFSRLSRNDNIGEVLLEAKNLNTPKIKDVSFQLHAGEIVGFAGLVGAGRTETVRALFGADKLSSGEIFLEGKQVHFKSPADAIAAGIAFCPEDRKDQGLFLRSTIRMNINAPVEKKVTKGLFIDTSQERKLANEAVEKYEIKTPTIEKKVVELSGGNQQKVILGRWTSEKMPIKVLILDEPTKGIDVGTRAEIYQTICDFAKNGIGIIYVSSELPEVLGISDRIYIMHEGRITGCVSRDEATEEGVLAYAMVDNDEGESANG